MVQGVSSNITFLQLMGCDVFLIAQWSSMLGMNNARDTNYFTKKITNCWCDEWLLVNEKSDINGGSRWK